MKRISFLTFGVMMLLFYACFTACKKEGPQGPAGSKGAQGAPGAKGAKGDPGSADVIYSDWIRLDSSKWTEASRQSSNLRYSIFRNNALTDTVLVDTMLSFKATITADKITRKALDQGLVLVFFKNKRPDGSENVSIFYDDYGEDVSQPLRFFDYQNNRILANDYTVMNYYFNDLQVSEGAITTDCWVDKFLNSYYYIMDPIATYTPPRTKTEIRYVIIPGGTAARMKDNLHLKDYRWVKNAYHIPD